jgi:hypothetical protein
MPPLFSKTFPPSGYDLQLAHQNVIHRLRRMYLSSPATTTPLQLIQILSTHLASERPTPNAAMRGKLQLYPYRRPSVFAVEVKWVAYFVREAGVLERWEGMTGQERQKQGFAWRLYPVPRELGIIIRKAGNARRVRDTWAEWCKEKRGELDMGGEEEEDEDEKDVAGDGNGKEGKEAWED